jgi:hypothetical protein
MSITPLCRNCEIETRKHCDECGGYGSDLDSDSEEDNTLRKVDYVFDCIHCGIHIELNSEEHDNCVTNDGQNWFCEKCHKFCEDEDGEKFD